MRECDRECLVVTGIRQLRKKCSSECRERKQYKVDGGGVKSRNNDL